MRRIIALRPSSAGFYLKSLLALSLLLHGCALVKKVEVKSSPAPLYPEEKLERNHFMVPDGEDVIGRLAKIRLEKGDTLPDIARHFSLGLNEIMAANPGVDMWVPEAGERIALPLRFILPEAPRKGIVINLAAMRLFHFMGDGSVSTFPIGIGSFERPTPMGKMYVERKMARPTWYVPESIADDHRKNGDPLPAKVPPGPLNPLGEYALYLNMPSYLIHGTNKPASIGLRATNGCIRLYPEHVKELFESTPVKTPVSIVHQPYLIGRCNGLIYLEVHSPLEGVESVAIEKIYAKLKEIEKKSLRKLDWRRVEQALAEARGIPVPVSLEQGVDEFQAAVEVRHPDTLHGRPEMPELTTEAWYVLASVLQDPLSAARMAAIINHQGPPIPARVLSSKEGYRVMAGPFADVSAAANAVKRLKIDLEIEGLLIEPDRKK